MPTAYSYIRFSSLAQRHGASEARQEESPEPWCRANGYTLDTTLRLRDLGKSAYHGTHLKTGALGAFLKLAEGGQIEPGSALLIEHLDRLTRQDPLTGMELLLKILNAKIDVVTLMDGQKYSKEILARDLSAQIKLQFTLFQSYTESDKKSVRLYDRRQRDRERARSGGRMNSRRPHWINADGSVDESKAEVIRRILNLAASGRGPVQIARVLNQEGVKPPGKGRAWSRTLIGHYMKSRATIGEYQPHKKDRETGIMQPIGAPIKGYYRPIVTEELWLEVQRQVDQRSEKGVRGPASTTANLFTRLCFCPFDGSRWRYQDVYLVPADRMEGIPGSFNISIRYKTFEQAFLYFVREIDAGSLFTTTQQGERADRLAALKGELLRVESRIDQAKRQAEQEENVSTILKLISKWEGEAKSLARRIENLKAELITTESKIFTDMQALLSPPRILELIGVETVERRVISVEDFAIREKLAASIRMVVDRIDLLPIHTGYGPKRLGRYLLYAEILFSGGQRRFFVTDQDGTVDQAIALPPHGKKGIPMREIKINTESNMTIREVKENPPKIAYSGILESDEHRLRIIRSLIPYASEKWRPLLEARFGK